MHTPAEIRSSVKGFVEQTFLEGGKAVELTDTTDLVAGGLVDSMNVLRLVEFIEDTYDFMLEPEELFQLTSVENVARLIHAKLEMRA